MATRARGSLLVVAALSAVSSGSSIHQAAPAAMTHVDLMVANATGPWAGFRIPGFAAVRGHLLVFAEARTAGQGCADFGHHDLVMRRSTDDGASWEPLRVIMNPDNSFSDCNATEALPCTHAERVQGNCQTGLGRQCDGGCAVWDPMPVVDNRTGAIHLFFSRSTSSCKGTASTGRRGPTDKADMWVMTSTDLGQSFGPPTNLTMNCSYPYGHGAIGSKLHGWVPSGGHGIQLSTGELVAPTYNNAGQGLCISSDSGRSWHAGGWLHGDIGPYDGPYEGEVVELFGKTANGGPKLLYDTRIKIKSGSGHTCGPAPSNSSHNVTNCRMTYTSSDLGQTVSVTLLFLCVMCRNAGSERCLSFSTPSMLAAFCHVSHAVLNLPQWTSGTLHAEMPDPSCKGGIVRGAGGALFAVGADSESLRVHDSIWASLDDGVSFPHKLRVDSSGGYSTVQMTDSGMVASVYEYAGDRWNSSVARAGGCHIRIAMVDPAAIVPIKINEGESAAGAAAAN